MMRTRHASREISQLEMQDVVQWRAILTVIINRHVLLIQFINEFLSFLGSLLFKLETVGISFLYIFTKIANSGVGGG